MPARPSGKEGASPPRAGMRMVPLVPSLAGLLSSWFRAAMQGGHSAESASCCNTPFSVQVRELFRASGKLPLSWEGIEHLCIRPDGK
jgi:hypothetical protein